MRSLRDGENVRMSPKFPRLHVNDTEKGGGPKAPPRNKMALYEQLSIPSPQRFSSGSSVPTLREGGSTFLSMPSSNRNNGTGFEMNPIFSSSVPPPRGVKLSNMITSQERKMFMVVTNDQSFNKTQPLQLHHISDDRSRLLKELGDDNDFRDPALHCPRSQHGADQESERRLTEVETNESLNRSLPSSNQEHMAKSVDVVKRMHGLNAVTEAVYREDDSKVRRESHSNQSLNKVDNVTKYRDDKRCVLVKDVDGQDDVSEICIMGSVSALDISPGDVVRIIGEKQFWKARKAIVNQQRIFAVQVFELHRLVKVQKVMAESPHLLLRNSLYMGKASTDVSLKKKTPVLCKPKDQPHKSHFRNGVASENTTPKLPLPSLNSELGDGLITNKKPSVFHFPTPENQWLVLIMSPSEGLVYKPVTGPYPPTSGFIAPMYNGCCPVNYGFPPYGLPIVKSSITDINTALTNQSSHDMSSQISEAMTQCIRKFQAPKESDVQRSTASSPSSSRVREADVLPLFPTEPTVANEEQIPVIKVVPHNRRLAAESAARIFQCIQEERRSVS